MLAWDFASSLAGWWCYRTAPMLGNTPWHIIGGEFLIALSLPAAISLLEKRHWGVSIGVGICQGLWTWVAYALAFRTLNQKIFWSSHA